MHLLTKLPGQWIRKAVPEEGDWSEKLMRSLWELKKKGYWTLVQYRALMIGQFSGGRQNRGKGDG